MGTGVTLTGVLADVVEILPTLQDVIVLVAMFWATYQMIGILRAILGYKSEPSEDK